MQDLTLAVFGPGLLGGSLLMDARAHGVREIRAWARRPEAAASLTTRGLADFASTDAAAVATGADLIILATPVGSMAGLAAQIAGAALGPQAVVTDVGSVKGLVVRGAGVACRAAGVAFVGSHPMAGSETTGLDAARAGLFDGAACILTPEEDTPAWALEKVDTFWQRLGCRTAFMDADVHDGIVARISHMPHLAAAAVTLAALEADHSIAAFAAGGLRDTTRVASGDPAMWREILLENRDAVLPALADLHRITGELLEILERRDEDSLHHRLDEARRLRKTRYP